MTATELKNNMGKYLEMVQLQDILITKNGKYIAKLTNSNSERIAMAESLFGVLPEDTDLKEGKEKRLKKYE